MICSTSTPTCCAQTKCKPFYNVNILFGKSDDFCSILCRNNNLKELIKDDINKGIYLEKKYEECPLCSSEETNMIELNCRHKICSVCIAGIFDTSMKCPICRTLIIMKSKNDKISDYYRESITTEHIYLIDTIYKLVNSIDYEFDTNILQASYFSKTNRDVSNDIMLIQDYLNMFIFKI